VVGKGRRARPADTRGSEAPQAYTAVRIIKARPERGSALDVLARRGGGDSPRLRRPYKRLVNGLHFRIPRHADGTSTRT